MTDPAPYPSRRELRRRPASGPAPSPFPDPPRPDASALIVDWTACEGRGLCVDLLPELLDADPWGYPKPRDPGAPGTLTVVPAHLTTPAKRAVHLCPRLALRLSTD